MPKRKLTKNQRETRFRLDFSGEVLLGLEEIWPDEDWPKDPTVEDVARVIRDSAGGLGEFLRSWALEDDVDVRVLKVVAGKVDYAEEANVEWERRGRSKP